MRKFNFKANLFLLSSLLSASLTLAQTTTVNGIVRTETPVKEGKIIVYLPDIIQLGNMISGTVITTPNGNTEKEKARNKAAFAKYKVNIGGIILSPVLAERQPVKFIMAEANNIVITRSDDKTIEIASFPISVTSNPRSSNKIIITPTHALTGAPVRITGPFDGDASNTKCRLDGKEMEILAESPAQTICTMPQTTSGAHTITIEEKGTRTEKNISAVNMDLSAPKTNLRTGERTTITVLVSGLQGLSSNAAIAMTNSSPSTINLSGGNTQTINITPSQVGTNGTYTQTFTAQSLSSGNFTVNADLHLPDQSIPLVNIVYTPPVLLNPADGTTLDAEFDKSPTFGWAPVTPKPDLPVKYKITIVPVYPGQTSGDAFRTNAPVLNDSVIDETFYKWLDYQSKPEKGKEYAWRINPVDPFGVPYFPDHPFTEPIKFSTGTNNNVAKGPCDKVTKLYEAKKDSCNKKNCDKELADLEAAKKALEDALKGLTDAKNTLDNWNKQNGKELDDLNKNMGSLQRAALNAANALTGAKQALINGMKKGLASAPGKNDGLAYSEDQLTESRDHYTEVQSGIFVYSHNPFNNDPKNIWDSHVKNEVENKLSGNNEVAKLLKDYKQAIINKANADKKLSEADARREALNGQRISLVNAVNTAQAAVAKATEDLKQKQDAYNKCIENQKRICRETEELRLKLDSCGSVTKHITEVAKGISGSPANPQNGNRTGTKSATANGNAQDELNQANDALNNGDYSGADQHATNADNASKAADKTKELEDGFQQLMSSISQLEKQLAKAKADHSGDYSGIQNQIDILKTTLKALATAIANNDPDLAGKISRGVAELIKQINTSTQQAIAKADAEKKRREEYARKNTPKPKPILGVPVNPDNSQLKMFARTMVLEQLYRQELLRKAGDCDCKVKALGLANKSNNAAAEAIGNIGVGVAFAPLEAFPGFSLATRLGIGVAKSIGSALFGGKNITEEMARNLFNVIGGEIFPELVGSELVGNRLNELASGGLEAILSNSGARMISWGGEVTLEMCKGINVKGTTTLFFNPKTGWVTMIIKIDGCDDLTVVKYQVNGDGTPFQNTTSVTTVKG